MYSDVHMHTHIHMISGIQNQHMNTHTRKSRLEAKKLKIENFPKILVPPQNLVPVFNPDFLQKWVKCLSEFCYTPRNYFNIKIERYKWRENTFSLCDIFPVSLLAVFACLLFASFEMNATLRQLHHDRNSRRGFSQAVFEVLGDAPSNIVLKEKVCLLKRHKASFLRFVWRLCVGARGAADTGSDHWLEDPT